MKKRVSSKPGTLTTWDFIKTAVVTAGIAIGDAVLESIKHGAVTKRALATAGGVALIGAVVTILQRLSTNSEGKIGPEPPKPGSDNPNS